MKKTIKRIALLGATGSIGTSSLRVLRALNNCPGHDTEYKLELVSAGGGNIERLAAIAAEFAVPHAVTSDDKKLPQLRSLLPSGTAASAGEEVLCALLREVDIDIVIAAIVGTAAIPPVVAAIEAGRTVALASKEVMVSAGGPVMRLAAEKGVKILPVDSEHSAVFQCLDGHEPSEAERLILTASGGPFRHCTRQELERMTLADAMKHPTWSMGPKVTLDSATLMNKALEMVEAHHLFAMEERRIGVLIHPQSIVHSMVEWVDGSVTALLSVPDMAFPIQNALTYPVRCAAGLERLNLAKSGGLTFEYPREDVFPSLEFARIAMRAGGTMGTVMNAANEAACIRFAAGEIRLPDIWTIVEKTMSAHTVMTDWRAIPEADAWARSFALALKI